MRRPMIPPRCLFVYGTLRQGYENPLAQRLHSMAKFLGTATMPGELYLCTGGTFPYPAARHLPDAKTLVVGEVYDLANREALLCELDRYEGMGPEFPEPWEYVRHTVSVLLEGKACEAWCYLANHPVAASNRIPSGDFRQAVPPAHT